MGTYAMMLYYSHFYKRTPISSSHNEAAFIYAESGPGHAYEAGTYAYSG